MILERYSLACLSHASYLVADETTRRAAVIDPQRDVDRYLADAAAKGLTIAHVILTHFHADFVSGHLELAEATGADVRVGARGTTDYPSVPVRDGDVLDLGPGVRLAFLETPGHTPESVCVLVFDRARDPSAPVAVFTGDTLFVGDVGRPDLAATGGGGPTPADLAGQLHDSLVGKLLPLPDATVVYPAHGAGSLCGKALGAEPCSPLGVQKRTNAALLARTRDEFVRLVTADLPELPAYFAHDAALNRRRRPMLAAATAAADRRLGLDEVLAHRAAGATLLDVRPAGAFAAGHVKGSVHVGLVGRFASTAGAVVDRPAPDRSVPIVVLAPPGKGPEAVLRLGRVGFDGVVGVLDDVPAALAARPDVAARLPRTAPDVLADAVAAGRAPWVLDVRSATEFAAGHVPGAVNVPLTVLPRRLSEVPRDRPVVTMCETGYRSSTAASLLLRAGHPSVADADGGHVAYLAMTSGDLGGGLG